MSVQIFSVTKNNDTDYYRNQNKSYGQNGKLVNSATSLQQAPLETYKTGCTREVNIVERSIYKLPFELSEKCCYWEVAVMKR